MSEYIQMMVKNILIVDDNFEDLNLMKSVLTHEGYDVSGATNGAKAMDLLDQKFDLILIDIQMPTLSGYDLMRLIREQLKRKSKIIYVSVIPKKQVDMNNIDGFVQKPFKTATFLKSIKSKLGGGK
jgi:CheY-like chemotaxis protein